MKLNIDIVAPDSENSMIKRELMEHYIETYKKIVVMFDNDAPGISSMEKYKQIYPGIEVAILPMSKDPSDSIKDFGAKEVRNRLVPILDKKIQS
jgi:DNA primase